MLNVIQVLSTYNWHNNVSDQIEPRLGAAMLWRSSQEPAGKLGGALR